MQLYGGGTKRGTKKRTGNDQAQSAGDYESRHGIPSDNN